MVARGVAIRWENLRKKPLHPATFANNKPTRLLRLADLEAACETNTFAHPADFEKCQFFGCYENLKILKIYILIFYPHVGIVFLFL